jgi:hypothetical protein
VLEPLFDDAGLESGDVGEDVRQLRHRAELSPNRAREREERHAVGRFKSH